MALINAIELNQSYVILSVITDKIYLDENRNCFLFYTEYEAKAFALTHDDTKVSEPEYRIKKDFMSTCYAQGAIHIIIAQNGRTEEVSLGPGVVNIGFYNCDLNADVALLKQTKRKHYMNSISTRKFIVPIRIKNKPQEIVYAVAKLAEDKPYIYIGFSDLEEYQLWADKVEGWKPLLVEFDTMCQISKDHGFLINPFGNRFMLPADAMNKCNFDNQKRGDAK